jgi:hypothetical protein
MPREVGLPPIFAWLNVRYVQQVSPTELSASCPQCGGEPHPNGEWPDRLRIFLDSKPLAWCRRCNYMRFADQGEGELNPDELEKWRKEQEQREMARQRSAERALANLRSARIWERYHEALDDHARSWWHRRGVPAHWQDWWQLGWRDEYRVPVGGDRWHRTPAASIPLLDASGECANIKLRLVNPPNDAGKYRYELRGQAHPPFLCNPEQRMTGHVIAVEGEIKAMVTFLTLDDANTAMVGLPGASPGKESLAVLSDAEHITLVMDPGAREAAWNLVKQLGRERCSVLIPPVKIDDGILQAQMTRHDVRRMLRNAIPCRKEKR